MRATGSAESAAGSLRSAARAALLLILTGCAASLPRRLVDADPTVKEKAKKEWSALPPAQQFDVMREGLRGGDRETRRIAALALDCRCLSLEEIHLQMAVLAERPDELWDTTTEPTLAWVPQHYLPVGSPDLPTIWNASLRVQPSGNLVRALSEFHRAALPSHVSDLVPLLPKAGPDLFPILLWQLQCLAGETDEHRPEIARGLLYGLARLRAERRGAPPPDPLSSIHLGEHEAFLTIAEASWGLCEDGGFRQEHIDAADVWLTAPLAWLHRWAKEMKLTAADRPFLARVAAAADFPHAQVWAVKRLAELGDKAALRKIAAGDDDDPAFLAAAELARRGERRGFDERVEAEREFQFTSRLLWYADPKRARQEWLRTFQEERQEAKEAIERGEEPSAGTAPFPEDPEETQDEWGIRIAPEDVAWIGEQLFSMGAPPDLLVSYFVDVNPDALTGEAARRVLEGLRAVQPGGIDRLGEFLGLCEVRDRAAVVDLLNHWAATDAGKTYALPLLAKLGETAHTTEMVATWDDWELGQDKWTLGRVQDPRVEEFLRQKALASEGDPTSALDALSTFYGLADPGLSWRNDFDDADWAAEPFASARKLILEKRPSRPCSIWRSGTTSRSGRRRRSPASAIRRPSGSCAGCGRSAGAASTGSPRPRSRRAATPAPWPSGVRSSGRTGSGSSMCSTSGTPADGRSSPRAATTRSSATGSRGSTRTAA